MINRIEELMRGSCIEYQEENPLSKDYCKWFKDIVWGISSDDETQRDILQVGKYGRKIIDISSARGIEITEDILLDYGFLHHKNSENITTYYRDDIGFISLAVYGLEHIYMKGKSIKYLHNFQRVFLDYTGKLLYPKKSDPPKDGPKLSFQLIKPQSGKEILDGIDKLTNMSLLDRMPGPEDFKF